MFRMSIPGERALYPETVLSVRVAKHHDFDSNSRLGSESPM